MNERVDKEAKLKHHSRPAWVEAIYQDFVLQWNTSMETARSFACLHLAVAREDMSSRQNGSSADLDVEEPIEPLVDSGPAEMVLTDAFMLQRGDWLHNAPGLEEFSFQTLSGVVQWIEEVEASANFVSLNEIFTSFCLDKQCSFSQFGGRTLNPFVPATFASELRRFSKCFKGILRAAGCDTHWRRVRLTSVGLDLGLEALSFSWSAERRSSVFLRIRSFTAGRRVKRSQGLSRPCNPVAS